MNIGQVKLDNNVFLAPMAGTSDLPYRVICKEMGAGLVYSEMVSAKAISYNNKKTEDLMEISPKERPISMQLFGSEPQLMADMAVRVQNTFKPDIIDVNMGCPVPKVVNNGEGSALMKNPKLVGEIVKAMSSALDIPLTIKIRKGFDDDSVNATQIAIIAQENGAAAVGVHGRTRQQYYQGEADWSIIKAVKEVVDIPVIGNGDIFAPEDAKAMLEETGCDGVMIGRGCQGNPWIFKRTVHYLNTGELLPEPSLEVKGDMILHHGKMLSQYKGEFIGIKEMRRHVAWYLKGLPHACEMRRATNHMDTYKDLEELVKQLLLK